MAPAGSGQPVAGEHVGGLSNEIESLSFGTEGHSWLHPDGSGHTVHETGRAETNMSGVEHGTQHQQINGVAWGTLPGV